MYKCNSCPRKCNAQRVENEFTKSFCGMPYNAVVARAALHYWEEPIISGKNGSGAIFFSGCSMRCIFCQNLEISHNNKGKMVNKAEFIKIIKSLEEQGANNINLVNPTHFIPFIREVLTEYKPKIPVVYNTGGYDSVESLKSLEGLIDIYLPDIKYYDSEVSRKYSNCADYFVNASKAVIEMQRQVKSNVIENDLMKRGIIIRHLVLPKNTDQSIKILNWINDNLPKDTFISLMSQYTPCNRTYKYNELNRRIVSAEYSKVIKEYEKLGFYNGFMQERTSADTAYIPNFDLTGV